MVGVRLGPVACFSYLAAASLWNVDRFPQANHGAVVQRIEASIAADGPVVAAVLAALEVPAQLISNDVGDDVHGDPVRQWLRRHRVDTTARETPGMPTPQITVVADERGTRTWFPYLPGVADALATRDLTAFDRASLVYIDCYQVIETAAVRAIEAGRRAGVPLLVNLGGSALSPAVIAAAAGYADLIVQTNVDDAEHDTAGAVAASLLDQTSAAWVVVTAGAFGAVAARPDERLSVPAFDIQLRHTHCAGAAFSGGLIYGVLRGWSMTETLTLAAASGGMQCERAHRDRYPDLNEVRAFAARRGRPVGADAGPAAISRA